MTNFEYFAKAFRFNSGKSILDSGDFYGRHYEKPPISEDSPTVKMTIYNNEIGATIESAKMLSEFYTVDKDIQERFEEWLELPENSELCWFEAGEQFAMEVLGLEKQTSDNTYNGENDLAQDYQWSVYGMDNSDWYYANDDTLVVIHAHTGCDIRGGYSPPLFLRPSDEYAIPMALTVGYYIIQGRSSTGDDLTDDECYELSERWSNGYSNNPTYEMSKSINRVFRFTQNNHSVIAHLNTGEIVRISIDYYLN
jgi:hypothetical protein